MRACSLPRYRTVAGGSPGRERAAAKRAGATLIDLTDSYCNTATCPAMAAMFSE